MLFKRKLKNIALTEIERNGFKSCMLKLEQVLKISNLDGHAQVIRNLIALLNNHEDNEFAKSLNSINMWGGSGAVWEVYIEDTEAAKEFEQLIIVLIDMMEGKSIMGKGIKPIRKLFKENINKNQS